MTEKKEHPAAMNAFELISMSKGLNLGNLFEIEQVIILAISVAFSYWYCRSNLLLCEALCISSSFIIRGSKMAWLGTGSKWVIFSSSQIWLQSSTLSKIFYIYDKVRSVKALKIHVVWLSTRFLLSYIYQLDLLEMQQNPSISKWVESATCCCDQSKTLCGSLELLPYCITESLCITFEINVGVGIQKGDKIHITMPSKWDS